MTLPDYIKEVKERLERATPGPWWLGYWNGRCFENHTHSRDVCNYQYSRVTDNEHFKDTISGAEEDVQIIDHAGCNAELIAKAPEDLVKLIRIVEVMREAIDSSIARSDDYGDSHCSQPIRQAKIEADKIARGEG